MTAELDKIQVFVSALVKDRLPKGIKNVTVEPATNEDGDEYLMVVIELASADIDDEALETLLEEIEAKVASLDERYPSVRFLDAA